jgi:hypothetical protein
MLEIFESFISILTGDSTLLQTVKVSNILTGPVDILQEQQSTLLAPAIILSQVSEVMRSVPLNTRDTMVQLDIYSRNSQLELETIYERVLLLLNYDSGNQNTAHIFWQKLSGAVDQFESDRRIWHRSCTFTCWAIKP